jgi:hypothetical protein
MNSLQKMKEILISLNAVADELMAHTVRPISKLELVTLEKKQAALIEELQALDATIQEKTPPDEIVALLKKFQKTNQAYVETLSKSKEIIRVKK